jgi:hypothetical protein
MKRARPARFRLSGDQRDHLDAVAASLSPDQRWGFWLRVSGKLKPTRGPVSDDLLDRVVQSALAEVAAQAVEAI